jgi:hypothetical protein
MVTFIAKGAEVLKWTVAVELPPPNIALGENERLLITGIGSRVKTPLVVAEVPATLAVIVSLSVAATALLETAKVAVLAPPATFAVAE